MMKWRMILVNVVITVLTAIVILTAREAFFTWQRVNALWMVAVQNAQAQQAPQPPKFAPPAAADSPKK